MRVGGERAKEGDSEQMRAKEEKDGIDKPVVVLITDAMLQIKSQEV